MVKNDMSKIYFNQTSKKIRAILVALVFAVTVIGTPLAVTTSTYADATYSCGSYGAGAYSSNTNCNGSTVGAPNTGFAAKLMQPSNLIAIVISLLLLAGGVGLILRSSRKRKKAMSFSSDNK